MNNNESISLTRIAVMISILIGLTGLFGAWMVLPYRVGQNEVKIKVLEDNDRTQQDILIRIDENVKLMREEQRRKSSG
jgi:hypothetical protein